ncbi:MAG: toll/interleukin-1 receptor domain-containing protein [Chloroflexi bacterium]|nr:toll/interleukin-1 receptor domain-containing protein [Chloroflexota bacterium]
MIENPHKRPAPNDALDRVHEFARDLAYGAAQGLWATQLQWREFYRNSEFFRHLNEKWDMEVPSEYLMLSMGYITLLETNSVIGTTYLLADKAFDLLEQPTTPPNVFISYRRADSSALALLVEARLKLAGNPNPFIDKNIMAGDDWSEHLKERVREARYFVLLIGQTTLDSPEVLRELRWAEEFDCTIISIWHAGRKVDESTPTVLKSKHAIFVTTESALGYETAINQLLNSLGYATY